jgi:hypothetical protein
MTGAQRDPPEGRTSEARGNWVLFVVLVLLAATLVLIVAAASW